MQKGYILGYDLNEAYAQISYLDTDKDEPETWETATDNFRVPLVIGYLNDRWIYGREANSLLRAGEGDMVGDLFTRALHREKVTVAGKRHDAVWLLSKFITLSLEEFAQIDYLTFTVSQINVDISKMLHSIGNHAGFTDANLYVQDYKESFCYYMFYQPKELWQYESALFDCDEERIDAYMLRRLNVAGDLSGQTFVTVDEVSHAQIDELRALSPILDPEMVKSADESFTAFIRNVFDKKIVSSVYLTGAGFENNWYPESLKVLCNGRRAFVGNNLYSKGACYTSMFRMGTLEEGPVYLDETRMMQRVSLRMRVDGQECWYPIVDWGTRWYEADHCFQVLLEDTEDIEIHIEDLSGDDLRVETVSLAGLPERRDYSLRLQIEVMFLDEGTMKLSFKDLGFGDFFAATDFTAEKIIQLGGTHGQFNSMS